MELRPSNSMKPMLFNTEMVRAILGGCKTVTRRAVKPQPTMYGFLETHFDWNKVKDLYRPEDILYVRETFFEHRGHFYYKADGKYEALSKLGIQFKWRPSIHMPKKAARIFLRVTDVRVERLQNITDEQAEKEDFKDYTSTALGFAELWDSTIKPKDRALYGWAANPWVWVIEFERISKEEAER